MMTSVQNADLHLVQLAKPQPEENSKDVVKDLGIHKPTKMKAVIM